MAANPAADPAETVYGALFARYIDNGLALALANVRAAQTALAEADRQQAWHLLSYALQKPAHWPGASALLLALAPGMRMAGYRHEWLAYLEQGLVVCYMAADGGSETVLHLEIGELHRHLGEYAEAERHFAAAQTLARQGADPEAEAAALVCLAYLAYLTQRPEEALHLADATLAKVAPEAPLGARAFFVRGLVHDGRRDFEAAEHCFRQARAIWSLANDKRWVALCLQNLAGLAQERQRYDEAIDAYRQAAALLEEIGDRQSIAAVAMNLGIVHYLRTEYDEALALYRRAEAIAHVLLDLRVLAMVSNNIALALRERGDREEAIPYFEQSIGLWRRLGDVKRRINVEDGLGRLLVEAGHPELALPRFEQMRAELEQTHHDKEYDRLAAAIDSHRAAALAALGDGAGR